jgi:hypothetical protein
MQRSSKLQDIKKHGQRLTSSKRVVSSDLIMKAFLKQLAWRSPYHAPNSDEMTSRLLKNKENN